ncbi:MAG: DNA polymerase I [Gammaproteobacteria bacterium]|nr:DNA polymerase I [Gammaproteobacteria bacterium]
MQNTNQLVLVDGSSYLFRAYHGLPKLMSRNGEPTGAIKGVISMIQKLHDEYQPSHIAIVFDAPGKTFRSDIYEDYKAHRPPMDDELRVQIKPLLQLIESMGYPLIQIGGVEADDVIGTLAKRAVEDNMQVLISTSDKDLTQLIDGNTRLIDTMKMVITDHDSVAARFKVEALKPEQVVDFLGLVGDTADNIPGVPKVGPKTAAKWLAEYGNIDGIVANKDAIKGKVGEHLRDNIDKLYLSQELAQIKLDVELPDVEIAKLSMNAIDNETFTALCQRFDLTKLHSRLLGSEATNAASETRDNQPEIVAQYQLVNTTDDFSALIDELNTSPRWGFEILLTSQAFTETELIGISFATSAGKAFYLPLAHNVGVTEGDEDSVTIRQLTITETLVELKQVFANASEKFTYDAKLVLHALRRYGLVVNNLTDDVMIAAYVYQSTAKNLLDNAVERYLQYKMIEPESILGKGAKAVTLAAIGLDDAMKYACERADYMARLCEYLVLRVDSMPGLHRIYRDIEMPFIAALEHTEENGILLDKPRLAIQSAEFSEHITALEKRAYEIAAEEFNLNSTKQLQHVLFEKMQLPVIKKTPKGQPSTNEEVLQELAENHELPRLILENRSLTKLKSTYIDKLPKMILPATGRIHTTYNQAVTSTGRLSSSDPNLQNIPIRTAEGRKIRAAFIAPEGYKIMACDYSQIELRIMAHLSQDPRLISAFKDGKDIHAQTAAEIFELELEQVESDHRRKAKAINFGLIYGMSAFGLAKQIGVGRSEAGKYIESYFEKYRNVQTYMDDIAEFAKQLGYVETLFGRRLYIPDITSTNAIRRNAAERLSINAPMQGTAADIIKIAMNNVYQDIVEHNDIKLIMQVHDELVFEVREDRVEHYRKHITDIMQNAVELAVPLVVDSGIGDNWDEAH